MIELEELAKPRKNYIARKLIMGLVIMAVLIVAALQSAGYAVLVGDGGTTSATRDGMTQLNCAYFTGTERVITHLMRSTSDATPPARCPLVRRIPKMRGPL